MTTAIDKLDRFTRHYLYAAIWADAPEGEGYDIFDIAPASVEQAIVDCARFQIMNKTELEAAYVQYRENGMSAHPDAGSPEACAGHDFFLTRQHHGAGFWDRGLTNGLTLTAAAHAFPEVSLYIGDDGKVYLE